MKAKTLTEEPSINEMWERLARIASGITDMAVRGRENGTWYVTGLPEIRHERWFLALPTQAAGSPELAIREAYKEYTQAQVPMKRAADLVRCWDESSKGWVVKYAPSRR